MREPIFKIPRPVGLILMLILGAQLARQFLPAALAEPFFVNMALLPARFFATPFEWTSLATLISSGFIHSGWEHMLVNSVWLMAFGTMVARRLGTIRFFSFYLFCLIIAALVQLIATGNQPIFIVGASGAVSACMGASLRFAFRADDHPRKRLMSIVEIIKNRAGAGFILAYIIVNIIFTLLGTSPSGEIIQIAWQAHLGGFVAGLLGLPLFTPPALSASGGPGNVDYGNWLE